MVEGARAPESLPVRILDGVPDEPVLAVDGAWRAPGLNLSHWPGNTTPAELRHELSTGSALLFARLPEERRLALAAGCTALANNHYDTDGVCALFAVARPDQALPRAQALLDAARAGDFFHAPTEQAVCIDAVVGAVADPARSPLGAELADLPDAARHERAIAYLFEHLPALLDGELAPWAALWEPALAALRDDQADLETCRRDELTHLDWTAWTAPDGARSRRPGAPPWFDPGRHALFGATDADRVLAIGPGDEGCTWRLVIGTRSWFDLPGGTRPRPALQPLAARLNALEGRAPQDDAAWRAEKVAGASPELWFGAREHERFAEHHGGLRPSRLEPAAVRRAIADALRATLELPV